MTLTSGNSRVPSQKLCDDAMVESGATRSSAIPQTYNVWLEGTIRVVSRNLYREPSTRGSTETTTCKSDGPHTVNPRWKTSKGHTRSKFLHQSSKLSVVKYLLYGTSEEYIHKIAMGMATLSMAFTAVFRPMAPACRCCQLLRLTNHLR